MYASDAKKSLSTRATYNGLVSIDFGLPVEDAGV